MKKSIVTVATVSVVGFGSIFMPQTSFANPVHQLEGKQEKIKDQRSEVKKNLSKAEKEIANILVDLQTLNTTIEKTEKALGKNREQLKIAKKDIQKQESQINAMEEKIEERFEILKERAVSYQETGGDIGFLDVIFGSSNFNDFVSRVSAVTKITESDQELIGQIDQDKQEVEEKLVELEDMEVELKGMQELIVEQKEENEKRKKSLKNKKEKLDKKVDKLEMKDSDLAALETQVLDELAANNEITVAENTASFAGGSPSGVSTTNDSNNASATTETASNDANDATTNASSNTTRASAASNSEANTRANTASNSEANTRTNARSNTGNNGNSGNTTRTTSSNSNTNNNGNTGSQKKVASKTSGPKPNPAPSANSGSAIAAGKTRIGKDPYEFGGKAPGGFDCSGFVSWAYGQAGVSLPSHTGGMASKGTKVSYSEAQPGDLVFFDTEGRKNGHVGIYLGNGQFLGSQSSTGVAVASMNSTYWSKTFNGHVRRVK